MTTISEVTITSLMFSYCSLNVNDLKCIEEVVIVVVVMKSTRYGVSGLY